MPMQTQLLLSPSLESRDVGLLVPELREKIALLGERCGYRGILVGIGTTVRGPDAQARLWCRSRTPEDVARRRQLIEKVAPRLASLLKEEYALFGPPATAHLPMQSWHQLGEAVDVCAIVGGKATWDGSAARLIASVAKEIGLAHSCNEKNWDPKSRHWHMQLRRQETPLMIRGLCDGWADVEREMLERFEVKDER